MLKKNLEQREKPELIAIIQHMLRQEPELQWLLMTPLPTVSSRKSSLDPEVYRQQVLAAMAATESGMDLDEDIPGLLVGNTTPGERRVIASWTRDALTHKAAWSSSERYEALLAALERTN
jgi:hypothetical protein